MSSATVRIASVRDLLGIVRAIYTSRESQGARVEELRRLAAVGSRLATSLELAKAPPGSLGARAAVAGIQDAAEDLRRAVGGVSALAPVVDAAIARALGELLPR